MDLKCLFYFEIARTEGLIIFLDRYRNMHPHIEYNVLYNVETMINSFDEFSAEAQ